KEGVSRREAHLMHMAVWERVVVSGEQDPVRWADILPRLIQLSHDAHRPRALRALGQLRADDLSDKERQRLWDALRAELHRHRSIPEAEWALPESDLVVLDALYRALAPNDIVARYLWLFSANPELP